MKKLIAVLLLAGIAVFGAAVPCLAAPADGRREDAIRAICMEDKRVKDAVCITFGNTCAISLRCETIYFTNELNKLKSNIIQRVKTEYPDIEKLYVRCDLDIFLKSQKIEAKLKGGASVLELKDEILEVLRLAANRT